MNSILFRADSFTEIGTGDLMSLIQLSKYFIKEGWDVSFMTQRTESAIKLLESHNVDNIFFIESGKSLSYEINYLNSIVELNNIQVLFFEITERKLTEYKGISSTPFKACVCFDGHVPNNFQFVLDWSVSAQSNYNQKENTNTMYLLGPEYVILPITFDREKIKQRIYSTKTKNVLIAMGGADEFNITHKIVSDLITCNSLNLNIILGAGYLYEETLIKLLQNSGAKYKVNKNVKNMFLEYMGCDLGIGAGGLISSELIATRTPAILISTYEHQIDRCEYFNRKGLAVYLGHKKYNREQLINSVKNSKKPESTKKFNTTVIMRKFYSAYLKYNQKK